MAHYTQSMFQSMVDTPCSYVTRCYRIEKRDGTFIRITDHDTAIQLHEGLFEGTKRFSNRAWYTPIGSGLQGSAVRQESALKVSNVELAGALTSELISEDDLHNGAYEGAIVYISWVDSRVPWAGALRLSKFTLTDFNWDGMKFTAQSSNVAEKLGRKIGATYSKQCGHAFMDKGCGIGLTIDKTKWVNAKCVNDIGGEPSTNIKLYLEFDAVPWAAVNKPLNYFKAGAIKWLTGLNAGAMYPISSSEPRKFHGGQPAHGLVHLKGPPTTTGKEFSVWDCVVLNRRWYLYPFDNPDFSTGTPLWYGDGVYVSVYGLANAEAYAREVVIAARMTPMTDLRTTAYQCGVDAPYQNFTRGDLPTTHDDYEFESTSTANIKENVLFVQDDNSILGHNQAYNNMASTDYYRNEIAIYPFGQDGMQEGVSPGAEGFLKAIINLQYPTKATPAVGDTFELYAGCDKTYGSCKSTTYAGEINNRARFGGFPYIPGTQQIAKIGDMEV